MIYNAKYTGDNLFVTLFDLRDAFGSLPRSVICQILNSLKLPKCFVTYICKLYKTISVRIEGPRGTNAKITFHKVVYQGDPLSPLIFILCINSIVRIMTISGKEYCNRDPAFLVYADDMCLTTTSDTAHKNLTTLLAEKYKKKSSPNVLINVYILVLKIVTLFHGQCR